MNCPYCNHNLSSEDMICPNCGQVIAVSNHSTAVDDYNKRYSADTSVITEERQRELSQIQKKKEQKTRIRIISALSVALVAGGIVYVSVVVPAQKYKAAQSLFMEGNYEQAHQAFKEIR